MSTERYKFQSSVIVVKTPVNYSNADKYDTKGLCNFLYKTLLSRLGNKIYKEAIKLK